MIEIIIEIIKSGWWWPIVVLILGLVLLLKFNDDVSFFLRSLSGVFNRMKKIGASGMEMATHPIDQQHVGEEIKKDNVKEILSQENEGDLLSYGELMKYFDNKDDTYKEQEQIITDAVKNLKLNPDEKLNVLVRIISNLSLANSFEQTVFIIYEGQIDILLHLSAMGEIGATDGYLKRFYDEACQKNPTALIGYPFSAYMNFLITSFFIIVQENKYFITKRGLSFLRYISQSQKIVFRQG